MLWMHGRDFMILGDLLWILWIFLDDGYCIGIFGQMTSLALDFHILINGYQNALIFVPCGR